jgi:SAM-dependent methyltransferase
MARWLAGAVGPTGRVVATDIDTSNLTSSAGPNLEVRRHDIVADELDEGLYDLILVRYLLVHLSGQQDTVVDKLVRSLRPGGRLMVEESDPSIEAPVDHHHPSSTAWRATQSAMLTAVPSVDPDGGRHASACLLRHPELDVTAGEATASIERGDSPHAQFLVSTAGRWLTEVVSADLVTQEAADGWLRALTDPTFLYMTELVHRNLAVRRDPATR